jgi:hypothetical protein
VSVSADTVALIHATIIDGTGAPAKNDQAIVIIKGRIAKTGNSKNITFLLQQKFWIAQEKP